MRVAIIANSYDPAFGATAGGHIHFLEVARRWVDADITIFAPRAMRDAFLAAVPRAQFIAMPSFDRFTKNVRLDALLKALFSFTRARSIRRNDVVLATSHFLADTVPAVLAKPRHGAVIVWHVQAPPSKRVGNPIVNALAYVSEQAALLLVRACIPTIIVGSNWMARSLSLERPGKHIFVTTNGVDHAPPQTGEVRAISRTGAVYLGRVHPAKGIEDLIRAWGLLPMSCSSEILTIAGDCAPDYRKELLRLAHRCGVEERVRLTGKLSEAEKWRVFESAQLFAFAGREEGWGIALAEAMAAGLPCVTYDLPIFREIFPTGRSSAEIGNVAQLANLIGNLLVNEELREDLSRQARELAATFSWNTAAAIEWEALKAAAGA